MHSAWSPERSQMTRSQLRPVSMMNAGFRDRPGSTTTTTDGRPTKTATGSTYRYSWTPQTFIQNDSPRMQNSKSMTWPLGVSVLLFLTQWILWVLLGGLFHPRFCHSPWMLNWFETYRVWTAQYFALCPVPQAIPDRYLWCGGPHCPAVRYTWSAVMCRSVLHVKVQWI